MTIWNNQWGPTLVSGEGAFGDVVTAELTPMCQRDFAYGGHDDEIYEYTFGTGSISYENSMAVLATGASLYGTAFLRTDRALRYGPGQGALFRFTAIFSAPAAGVSLTAGAYGGSENGLFVGYNYADTGGAGGVPRFGFCRQYNGARDQSVHKDWSRCMCSTLPLPFNSSPELAVSTQLSSRPHCSLSAFW